MRDTTRFFNETWSENRIFSRSYHFLSSQRFNSSISLLHIASLQCRIAVRMLCNALTWLLTYTLTLVVIYDKRSKKYNDAIQIFSTIGIYLTKLKVGRHKVLLTHLSTGATLFRFYCDYTKYDRETFQLFPFAVFASKWKYFVFWLKISFFFRMLSFIDKFSNFRDLICLLNWNTTFDFIND